MNILDIVKISGFYLALTLFVNFQYKNYKYNLKFVPFSLGASYMGNEDNSLVCVFHL